MSLDVSLMGEEKIKKTPSSGIFVREGGQTIEISEEEWYKRNPDREPVKLKQQPEESNELYSANITHNLSPMAQAADLYSALWVPDEQGWTTARDITGMLTRGLKRLKADPEGFRKYNPDNGWGSYELLVRFVEDYLEACEKHPDATVEVSR
jgi:hypothetical protein